MSRPPAPSRADRADRRLLWLVLVLLVGLLGMHGIVSDHASGMPSRAMTTEALAAPAADMDFGGMPDTTTVVPVAVHSAAVPVEGPRAAPFPGDVGMVMAGLCLAVPTLGLLLLNASRRRSPGTARPRDRLLAWLLARTRALPRARPPDLVAGLCVSRT